MDTLNHQKKYQRLAEMLRERVKSHPSDRLPSIRLLMKQFGVSQHTVTAALAQLEKEELILRKHGSGIYHNTAKRPPVVAYFHPVYVSGKTDPKEHALLQACQKRGWTLRIHRFDPTKVNAFIDEVDADGFIINPAMITFDSPILRRVLAGGLPKVVLGRDTSNLLLDFVTGDDAMTLTEVMRGLTTRGHKRIAFLVSEPHFYEIEENIRTFERLSRALGLESHSILDTQYSYGQDGMQRCDAFMRDYVAKLRGAGLPFTAIITSSSSGSIPTLRILHESGFRVPQDCSLVCMGMDENARYSIPSISNVAGRHNERAESCIRILEQRMAGDRSPLLYERGFNPPVWRESVGQSPNAGGPPAPASPTA